MSLHLFSFQLILYFIFFILALFAFFPLFAFSFRSLTSVHPLCPPFWPAEDQGRGGSGAWRGQLSPRGPPCPQRAHLPSGPQWKQGANDEGPHPHHRRNHDVKG